MHRMFRTTTRRRQTSLEGVWDFVPDPDDIGLSEEWYSNFPAHSTELWVPGVWNTTREFLNYEGPAWFRKHITLESCAAAVLHFAAVTHQANIWLDGDPLGEHYGGFLPFSFLLPHAEAGTHELVVRVDNTHDMVSTVPSANLDWFRYGGIPRPVWIDELPGPGYIASLRLTPVVAGEKATLRVRAELANLSGDVLDDFWALVIDGRQVRSERIRIDPGDVEVLLFAVEVENAHLWSPADPRLYSVCLTFAGDDSIERTGFRELRIVGDQVLLNGEPLRLAGVNRHEDHPDWGFALPPHLLLRDLEILRGLGANSIRGSHYPNDQRLLDLCDERGILFMEEIPLWGFTAEQLRLDIIGCRTCAMLWAMIERDGCHPSIWAWSVLNECATDTPEGRAIVGQLVETAHEADPTRPVTFASNRNLQDICFDLVDIVSVNAYYGWYWHDMTWEEFLRAVRAKIGHKPLLVTEFGGGALYGWHTLEEGVIWSEEYQQQVLLDALAALNTCEGLAGFYIWQFCDTRTDRGERGLKRPRGYNNKGLLDEYRRPKMSYYAVRQFLTGQDQP